MRTAEDFRELARLNHSGTHTCAGACLAEVVAAFAGSDAAEWHRYLHAEGMLVEDEGEECGPWHHRVFLEGAAR